MSDITCLYELHSESTDIVYAELRDRIIDDVLMNKIRDGKLVNMTTFVKETIQYFYECANDLYKKIHFDEGCVYTVYRGTKQTYKIVEDKVVQPIPFSSSIDEENTDSWIGPKCCRWHIDVPLSTHFVGINNPNEGKEIVLPAGVLYIVKEWVDDGDIINYKCILEPTNSYSEMVELQKKYRFLE